MCKLQIADKSNFNPNHYPTSAHWSLTETKYNLAAEHTGAYTAAQCNHIFPMLVHLQLTPQGSLSDLVCPMKRMPL